MNISDLEKYCIANDKRQFRKPNRYFPVYERHFKRYRGKNPVILEIGIDQGGSLQMWKEYFGNGSKIYGIDINPECKNLEEDNIEIFIGSQTDRNFLKKLKEIIPPIDVIIDDGGHFMSQQIISFKELFSHVKNDGIYCCEDTGSSYILRFGGGHKRYGTFIEYSKNIIDYLHATHSEQKRLKVNSFTTSINSIHYYWGIVIIEKAIRDKKPIPYKTGNASFEKNIVAHSRLYKIYNILAKLFLRIINSFLRFLRIPGVYWR